MPYKTKKPPTVSPDGTFATGETTDRLLTPGEVAHIFGVDPKTVNRWSLTGKIPSIRTPSGQRRYRETDINALINASSEGGQKAR
ncbi:BldC family transcriptional regulator [Streptosporangium saharense]|uniref:BldC family transcriptional regulator n=1 Tax=Streptosporangium saharense TaxID=1706840 RepID=UPI003687BD8E